MGETSDTSAREGTRRQITVVFVDIVGSSALAAQTDAEDLGDWLEGYYKRTAEIVEARGGEVTEYLGDGVVACFGLQAADELAAAKAVDAALAMVAPLDPPEGWLKPVALRGGVATGEVATRSANGRLPQATGAVTTMAGRIQEGAAPGEVLIAQSTRELLRGGFNSTPMVGQRLKGFSELQTLYRLSPTDGSAGNIRPDPTQSSNHFVGRMGELDRIAKATAPCLIVGEAGIGKSALARAATKGDSIAAWLWADGLHSHSSHYPFRVWLRGLLGADGLSLAGLADAFADLSEEARLALALILGLPEGQQLLTQKANLALKGLIESALADALFSQAGPRATIVVEDLHWLDIASFGVLLTLLADPRSTSVRIVMTSREDTKIGQFLADINTETVSLGPLDIGEANAMVTALADGVMPDDDISWLVDTSSGVPLFLEQLFKLGNRGKQEVPATLKDLLAERIDGAGSVKPLLQTASILGRRFRRDVLAAVSTGEEALDRRLNVAVGQGVLEKVGPGEWAFSHALLHKATYHGILRRKREAIHSRTAQVLKDDFPEIATSEPALVAQHHARAREFAPAILSYLNASQKALYQGAMADAESHTRAAIDMCNNAPPEFDTTDLEIASHTSLGSILMQFQGFASPPVRESFETVQSLAMAAGRPTHNSAPALFGSFSHAIISGDMDRSEAFCSLLDTISDNQSNVMDMSEVKLAALTTKNCKCFYAGDFVKQFDQIAQIRELYDLAQHGAMIMQYGMDVFAAAQMFEPVARAIVGQSDQVPELIVETDAHQALLNIPVMLPYAMIWGAVPLFYAGHKDQALARLNEGIETADAQGAVFWQLTGRVWQAIMDDDLRATEEGRAGLRGGLDQLSAIGSGIGASYFEAHHARAMSQSGQMEAAYEQSAAAVDACAQSRLLCWYPEIIRLHALNCDAAGRGEEAEAMRQRGLEAAREQGAALWEARLVLDLPTKTAGRRQALSDVSAKLGEAVTLPELARVKTELGAR